MAERMLRGDSIAINRRYLDHLLVESRIVGAVHPSTQTTLFGHPFETPITTGALSHLKSGMEAFAQGAREAGAACFIGMGSCEELERVLRTGAKVIKIIKPYADPEEIFSRIRCAEENGAIAVGMDVEHAVNVRDDRDSLVVGQQMKLPTLEELRGYIRATKLPFVIKGALSVRDALTCAEIGCAGIVLSHHNGLMRWAVPPVMLIPEIRRAVGNGLAVISDGGIADGYDAYKALALGADAVSVGKPLMQPLEEGGAAAMARVIREMTDELKAMMVRTGIPDPAHMDPGVIHEVPWETGEGEEP
uniref:FMN-dependent alpha-hydroxy acid dehydrogenase n=1 Tax=uncultured bacterium Contig11 TaxID=1393376 RepID=W0FKJ9_9BACT|nr:FMN-dependent alpha-hydroxy acid dehydrogenase [uncultured bacterium Contig11]